MRWAVSHPLGIRSVLASVSSAGVPGRFTPPAVSALAAIDRLAVYGGGYFSRLHGALDLECPRLAADLGQEEFRHLVAAHLLRHPSTSPQQFPGAA